MAETKKNADNRKAASMKLQPSVIRAVRILAADSGRLVKDVYNELLCKQLGIKEEKCSN